MKLDDRTLGLVQRIRAEANITPLPGQYDRLQEIADHLKKLEPAIRKDEEAKVALFMAQKQADDLRTRIEALDYGEDARASDAIADVLGMLDGEEEA